MAIINGSVSSNPTKYSYYIDCWETEIDTVNNTSRVWANVYIQKISNYSCEGSNNSNTLYIDGTPFVTSGLYIDMSPETTPRLVASGSKYVVHSNDGSKTVTISCSGSLPSGGGFGPVSGTASGTFALTTIPREAKIISLPNFNIGSNLTVGISNTGNMTMNMYLYVNGVADVVIRTGITGGNYTFTFSQAEINAIYSKVPNVNSATFVLYINSYNGATYIGQNTASATCFVINSNPTFTAFTLIDTNATVIAVTGDSSKIVQNQSTMRVNCTTATGVNYATIVKYEATLNSIIKESATTTIDYGIVSQSGTVSVRAIDSRGNYTTVTKALIVEAYANVIMSSITLARTNLVEEGTTLILAGSYSLLTIGGLNKNSILETKYRYKESDSVTWGSYTAITPTIVSSAISYNASIGNFNTDKSYNFEVYVRDKLTNYTITGLLAVGTPLMSYRKGMIGIGQIPEANQGILQVNGLINISDKTAINSDGGIMVKLINKTGANTVKGEVVHANSGLDNSVIKIVINVPDPIGVFYESGIADGQEAWVVISGIADVYFVGNTVRGYLARGFVTGEASYVAGQAIAEAVPSAPFATDKHFYEIGHVIQSRTGAGLAKTVLHFN